MPVVRCTMSSVLFSTLLHVARCALHVVCCSLHIARCMAHVVSMLSIARCNVVCCIFPIACCMSSIFCCTFSSGALHVAACVSSAALLSVRSCLLRVICGLLSVACPSAPWCALSVAWPTSHLVSYMFCVASRRLHVARRTSPVCTSSLVRCVSILAPLTRSAVAHASHARRFAESHRHGCDPHAPTPRSAAGLAGH